MFLAKWLAEKLHVQILVLNIMGVPVTSGKTQQSVALVGLKIL